MAVGCIESSVIPFDTVQACESCFNDDYCVLVEETDTTELEFELTPITGNNVIPEGDMSPISQGTTDGAAALKLIDSTATFATDGVLIGAVIYNSTDATYHQVTAVDSETQLSVDVAVPTGKDYVITNWDITVGTWGAGVDYDGSQLTFDTAAASIRLTNRVETGKYYRLTIYSTFNEIGTGRLSVTNGAGTTYFLHGAVPSHTGTTIYFQASGTNIFLATSAPLGSGVFVVTDLEIVEMSSLSWELIDCDTETQIYDGTTTLITYNEDIQYQDNPNSTFWGVLSIAWADLALTLPDCVCLCVKDYGERYYNYVLNGGFDLWSGTDNATYWDVTDTGAGAWAFDGSTASHVAGVGVNSNVLAQTLETPLDATKCYILSFDYDSDNGFSLIVKYDTATTSNNNLSVVTKPLGTGTQQVAISNIAITAIKFVCVADQEFSIDDVAINLADDCWDCSCLSSCISIATDHDQTNLFGCNTLFTATNDNNAFGFNYEDLSLTHSLRLFAKLRNSSYNIDSEYYVKSSGEKVLVYSEREKVLELQVYEVPEGIHDALSMMLECDTFTIDGVEYVKIGDYAPNWRKSSAKAPVIVQVAKKTQDRFNTFS